MSDLLSQLVRDESAAEVPDGEATLERLTSSVAAGAMPPVVVEVGAGTAKAMGLAAGLSLKAIALGVVAAVGVAGGTWAVVAAKPEPVASAPVPVARAADTDAPATGPSAPATTQESEPPLELEPEPLPESEPEPSEPGPAPEASPGKTKSRPPSKKAKPEASAESELSLITRSRAALERKDHAEVLRLTRELQQNYPKGMLVEEREAMRAIARCARGTKDPATVASRFRTRFPGSVATDRVNAACQETP